MPRARCFAVVFARKREHIIQAGFSYLELGEISHHLLGNSYLLPIRCVEKESCAERSDNDHSDKVGSDFRDETFHILD